MEDGTSQVPHLGGGTGTSRAGPGLAGLVGYSWSAGQPQIKAQFLSFPLCKLGLMVLTFCEALLDRDIPLFQKGGNRSLPDVYLHTLWPEWLSVCAVWYHGAAVSSGLCRALLQHKSAVKRTHTVR